VNQVLYSSVSLTYWSAKPVTWSCERSSCCYSNTDGKAGPPLISL